MRIPVLILALLAGASAAQAMEPESIVPERWRQTYETYHFAPAVRAGNMLYLSGVVGSGETAEEQFTDAFRKIGHILNEAGADWDDVVEMTTYHIDMHDHMDTFMKVKDRFVKEPWPAWTAVGVTGLFSKQALVEIKITAMTGARMIPAK